MPVDSNSSQSIKEAFSLEADEVIKKRVKTEIQKRLDLFRDDIYNLRQANTSYKHIAELVKKVTTEHGDPLIVSVQALRTYCQDILGFPKIEVRATKTKHQKEKVG